ncbi:hypothetical protein GOBAR_AA21290 [Gossypium barbadense]|uniref:Uncharacterized protein n=1 Tax=Gossypium barbadense TaxID=3634 RepID=A0A2P5X7S3_GOSBA|nr:hypothetical protein GOBAR_AA21290 [Gossypium barbadense]
MLMYFQEHYVKKAAVPSSKRRRGPGSSSVRAIAESWHPFLEFLQALQEKLFQILRIRSLTTGCCIHWATVEQVVMMNNDDPGTIHFQLGSLVRAMSVPEFRVAVGLYTDEFIRSTASALAPSIRYLHAILAHTLTGRRESTGVVNTHNSYYLWCMANAHVTDLAYFIAFAIHHQTERHKK